MYSIDYDDDNYQEVMEDRWRRRQLSRLWANPDCRDPGHPGCSLCEETDEETETDEGE